MGLWIGAILYLYPRITRWFFKSYSDRVTQYVFILTLVFLAAWTAQLIGLEAVLGAFMAGLVLNRFVPMASPLMSSIEFVGNALFIPYFLIGVGMMINLRVALNPDTLGVATIMLAVALSVKWLPAMIARKGQQAVAFEPFGNVWSYHRPYGCGSGCGDLGCAVGHAVYSDAQRHHIGDSCHLRDSPHNHGCRCLKIKDKHHRPGRPAEAYPY